MWMLFYVIVLFVFIHNFIDYSLNFTVALGLMFICVSL